MRYYTLGKIVPVIVSTVILFTFLPAHAAGKRIVLLPLAIYSEQPSDYLRMGVASMLASRLSGGGVEIINTERVEACLHEKDLQGITSRQRAEEVVETLEADYGVFGSITAIGDAYSLDLALIDLDSKDMPRVTRVSKTAKEDQFIPVLSEVADEFRTVILGKEIASKEAPKPSVVPEKTPATAVFSKLEQDTPQPSGGDKDIPFKPTSGSKPFKPTGTIPLNMAVMSFDMGDLDGDGRVELVIVDRKKMLVYKRQKEHFVLQDTRKASWGEEFFKVSVADIDRNGTAEIYVVCLYGKRARTSVFERAPEFRRLGRKTGHIRAIKAPTEKGPFLLYQGSKLNEFFSGPMYHMIYQGEGRLIKGEKLPGMRGAQFYTLMPFELHGDGGHGWLGFGEADLYEQAKLHLWGKRGEVLWRGKEDLGGTNNAIRAGEKKTPEGLEPRIPFDSRTVFADIDGDGEKEVVTLANTSLIKHTQNFKVYTKSRLIAYERQGSALSTGWETAEIDYCVTDLQVQGSALFVAAHKGKVSNIGKESGVIMWFE